MLLRRKIFYLACTSFVILFKSWRDSATRSSTRRSVCNIINNPATDSMPGSMYAISIYITISVYIYVCSRVCVFINFQRSYLRGFRGYRLVDQFFWHRWRWVRLHQRLRHFLAIWNESSPVAKYFSTNSSDGYRTSGSRARDKSKKKRFPWRWNRPVWRRGMMMCRCIEMQLIKLTYRAGDICFTLLLGVRSFSEIAVFWNRPNSVPAFDCPRPDSGTASLGALSITIGKK